ncbi:hypothetical protein [Endozoicomonas sp. ONNA2]|uniref:hypothetical protein n=1 Tax=Endozoicomonas sp. ONNA2 TaxID=2828741 RepID=UPI0021492AEA|nr:hypothetical protein [Endozoicomonas sp. ONNA2]
MNTEINVTGPHLAIFDVPDNSEGKITASGSGNERPTPAWYQTDKAKTIWRGLAVVPCIALGVVVGLLARQQTSEGDGRTHASPMVLGACMGFLGGATVYLLNEYRLAAQKNSLDGRSVTVASSAPGVISTAVEICPDRHSNDGVSQV